MARINFGINGLILLALLAGGCQSHSSPATRAAARTALQGGEEPHLTQPTREDALKLTAILPVAWLKSPPNHGSLFIHQQWRSPTKLTGVGIVYARTPLPLSTSLLMWFAKNEYIKKQKDGKILSEWSDAFGRRWFEGENNKYHIRGFAYTVGKDAWIIYCGYRRSADPKIDEITLGNRSILKILPGIE